MISRIWITIYVKGDEDDGEYAWKRELILSLNFCIEIEAVAPAFCPSTKDRWSFHPEVLACSPDNPRSHSPPPPPVVPRHTWSRSRTCIHVEVRPDQCIRTCRSLCNPRRSSPPCMTRRRFRSPTWWNRPHYHVDIAWWSVIHSFEYFTRHTFPKKKKSSRIFFTVQSTLWIRYDLRLI